RRVGRRIESDRLILGTSEFYSNANSGYRIASRKTLTQAAASRREREVMRLLSALGVLTIAAAVAGGQERQIGYSDTPMLPGNRWHVHDGKRPQPAVVNPGDPASAPPSDAVVLFNGRDLDKWQSEKGGPARWTIDTGALVVAPK